MNWTYTDELVSKVRVRMRKIAIFSFFLRRNFNLNLIDGKEVEIILIRIKDSRLIRISYNDGNCNYVLWRVGIVIRILIDGHHR